MENKKTLWFVGSTAMYNNVSASGEHNSGYVVTNIRSTAVYYNVSASSEQNSGYVVTNIRSLELEKYRIGSRFNMAACNHDTSFLYL